MMKYLMPRLHLNGKKERDVSVMRKRMHILRVSSCSIRVRTHHAGEKAACTAWQESSRLTEGRQSTRTRRCRRVCYVTLLPVK